MWYVFESKEHGNRIESNNIYDLFKILVYDRGYHLNTVVLNEIKEKGCYEGEVEVDAHLDRIKIYKKE